MSAFNGEIWQSLFYLALCYFLRVGVCDSPQYLLDLSPLQSSYKYLSLCSQDRYQEWCLVCLIFLLFLQLYSSPFVWFFSRYTILSLSLIVCHEVFCFQEITEMNIGPIKGHTYLNKPAAFSKLFPW